MRIIILILMSPFLLLGGILGLRRRDIEYLPEGHPEMAKAIAESRSTLSEFRRLLATPEPGLTNFAIKVRFTVQGGTEHCWVGNLEMRGTGFLGKLDNHPQGLHGLSLGSTVDVAEDRITDWAYSKDGVYQGHFTTRALLPGMSTRMRQQVEKVYGWPNSEAPEATSHHMKYLVSIVIALALFVFFRRNHDFTLKTWFYLFIIHAPVPTLMFTIERSRKMRFHPFICVICTWIGGLALGFLVGPFLISLLGGKR